MSYISSQEIREAGPGAATHNRTQQAAGAVGAAGNGRGRRAVGYKIHPENLGRWWWPVPLERQIISRLGCPARRGKAAGWARRAMDLKNIKSIPG